MASTPAADRSRWPSGSSLVSQRYGTELRGQEVADLERVGRPAVADDLRPADRLLVMGLPQLDQRIDDGVELLLRWVPRLEQVVVKVDDVDGLDGRIGVGVRGQ